MAFNKIGIVDYGSGNFSSVWNAVNYLTPHVLRITTGIELKECSHVVIPGVGAYAAVMRKLNDTGLSKALKEEMHAGERHFLGICVGMHVLASCGHEFGLTRGLDIIKGEVVEIDSDRSVYPLPHMGWNTINSSYNCPLFAGMDEEATFYFLHSYHFVSSEDDLAIAFTDYGIKIAAAVTKATIHGVQFHPEKSQDYGMQLLRNFISMSV